MQENDTRERGSDTMQFCKKCSAPMRPIEVTTRVYDEKLKSWNPVTGTVGWIETCGCKDREIKEWERDREKSENRERQVTSNIPAEFILDQFGGWIVTKDNMGLHNSVLEYVEKMDHNYGRGRGILISGSPGIGKTRHACYVLARYLEKGIGGYFISFSQFVREYVYGETPAVSFWDLCTIPVVVLDDFGSEKIGSKTQVLFKEFFDRRMRGKVTIVTTMVAGAVLASNVGQYLMSRIFAATMPNIIDSTESKDMRVGVKSCD